MNIRMCEIFVQTDRGVIVCLAVMDQNRRALRRSYGVFGELQLRRVWWSWRNLRARERERFLLE